MPCLAFKEISVEAMEKYGIKLHSIYEDLEKVVVHSEKRKIPLCRQVYGFNGDLTNDDEYIKMHVKIEANKSSRIEETRTTVEEDLLDVTDINPEKRDDLEEVQNYVKTTNYGVGRIREGFPVCTRLIR